MRKVAMGLLCGCMFATAVNAEPSPTVSLLMNQPVTLFSMGIYKLRIHVEQEFGFASGGFQLLHPLEEKRVYGTAVGFDWDRNRIFVVLYRYLKSQNPEEECRQLIARLRNVASTEFVGKTLPNSAFAQYFLPEGYAEKKFEQTGPEIDKLIELRFQDMSEVPFGCSAPLIGTGYSIDK